MGGGGRILGCETTCDHYVSDRRQENLFILERTVTHERITTNARVVYTEDTVCIRTEESIHIVFKPNKRWNIVKMCDKSIPRANCIWKKTVHVSI